MNTLDQWEAEAEENFLKAQRLNSIIVGKEPIYSERILTLIDLVRKKDEALKIILNEVPLREAMTLRPSIHEALALTEELK